MFDSSTIYELFLFHLQEVRSLTAGMFSKTRLRVLCVYFPAMYLLSPEISKLNIWNCNLTCLSDLEIVLGGKLAKPLALENVILVRFCQLCVAVLSHLGHLTFKVELRFIGGT